MENRYKHIDYEELVKENAELRQKLADVCGELAWFKRQFFGEKSEKMVAVSQNPSQLNLFSPDMQAGQHPSTQGEGGATDAMNGKQEEANPPTGRKKRKKEHNRKPLPDTLERIEEHIPVDFDTEGLSQIGVERTEILEFVPQRLVVRVIVRPKYAKDGSVATAPMPALPIPGGNAGPSLIARITVAKYLEHMPLDRQSKAFARNGFRIAANTMGDWVNRSADRLLRVLYERLGIIVLQGRYVQADETPIRVQDPIKKGKCHRGFHWVYYAPRKGIVFFDYQKGRDGQAPREILGGFSGYLQTDGYSVYEEYKTEKHPNITLMSCMAHVRRKFVKALSDDRERAQHALNLIGALYGIERDLRALESEMDTQLWLAKREQVRQQKSKPIMEQFSAWINQHHDPDVPKNGFTNAVEYAKKRIDGLSVYLQDGRLEIDNNLVENQIRPVALGRKNYLFAGSHHAAENAAIIYSLIGSCQQLGINPEQYLMDVLAKLPARKANDIDDLLPHNWNPDLAWKITTIGGKHTQK